MDDIFYTRSNGKFKPTAFADVLYISASRNYSIVFTADAKKFIIYVPLGQVETQLPANLFCRIHRSYLISMKKITEFDYTHIYIGDEKLPIGRTYFENFLERTIRVCCERDRKIEAEIKNMTPKDYVKMFKKEADGNFL